MDLSRVSVSVVLWVNVPAHAGGVDLSFFISIIFNISYYVPAHAGGVDLSTGTDEEFGKLSGPRPCGRGGFKPVIEGGFPCGLSPRPCGRGGFKRVGADRTLERVGPRPCGRGGFKLTFESLDLMSASSPPMRAGWI